MEQDGRADRRQQNRKAQFEEGLRGHGGGKGEQFFEYGHQHGQKHGAIHRTEGEFFSDEDEAHAQQRRVDDEHQYAGGKDLGGNQSAENQRKTADAASGEVIGELEEISAQRSDEDADSKEKISLERRYLACFRNFHN